jgi:Calcineurin-like phosphoesterase
MRANATRAPFLSVSFLTMSLACGEQPGSEVAPTDTTAEVSQPATILAAGDIAGCADFYQDEVTAEMLADMPGTILPLGDLVYQNGTRWQFRNCYHPSWGRLLTRSRPAPGNHEYRTDEAGPYYEYFSGRAGPVGKGYYTYTLGAWRIYSLNSERNIPAQTTWLRNELKANPTKCVLAYWHKPLYTSGQVAPTPAVRPLFDELWKARAEVVLNGHNHSYERFDPQDADSTYRTQGVRQFVIGTGGAQLEPPTRPRARNSKRLYVAGWGVLKMTLRTDEYSWRFVPVPGSPKADSGSAKCV